MRDRAEPAPGEVEPSHMLPDPVMEPRPRGDRHHRVAAALVALLLTGVLAGTLWPFVRSPQTTKDRTPDPLGEITELAIEDGSAWALSCNDGCSRNRGGSAGRAIRIDPSSGKVLASAALEDPSSLAVGEGWVWVTNFRTNTLSRVDPKTAEVVATIQLRLPFAVCATCRDPHDFLPFDVAAGEGAVWVSTGRGAVARVDPAIDKVETVIALPGGTGGEVAAGEGAVWVADNVAGVHRIDPSTNRLAATITVEGEGDRRLSVEQVQAGGGSVWALGTWARKQLEAGGHEAFVSATGTALARIEPKSGEVVWVTPVAPDLPRLIVDAGSQWLIHGPTAIHIDSGTGKVDRVLEARTGERYVGVGAGASWVVSSEGELSRWEAPLSCPSVEEGFGPPALSPGSGPAGTTVTISGRLGLYDKDGIVYRPTEKVEIWWNLDPERWWKAESGEPTPAGPGPVALLTHDLPVGMCTFEGTFRVPNVAAGSYSLVAVHFGGSGSTAHRFASFTVTVPAPMSPVAPTVNGGTLDMTFPDGSTARIVVPAGQDLRSFPLQPDVTLVWPGHYVAPIVFSRGGPYEAILAGTEPEERLSSGETVWRSKSVSSWPNLHEITRWVVFSLPDWSVHVPVPPDIHPDEIVDAVDLEQSADGLVVVRVRAPVVMADSFGEGGGPQVAIGDRNPLPDVVDAGGPQFRVIELAPADCTGGRHLETDIGGPDELYASLCLAEGELFTSVYGDADFVRDVYEGLDVVSFTAGSSN